MTAVNKSALVRFSAQSMFALVDDIEAYPEFLPWCSGTEILSRSDDIVEARVDIAKGGFKKSFTTRNRLDDQSAIIMSLIDGPFSHLDGIWRFLPLRDDASKISLDLEFEMAGKLANLAFGSIFNQICNTMISSFTQRAKKIYG
jgi:ribosome-associated toxin RatA of RatAB toxin-antitoxin module